MTDNGDQCAKIVAEMTESTAKASKLLKELMTAAENSALKVRQGFEEASKRME